MAEVQYFPRGFGLKSEIEGKLREDYRSRIVDALKRNGFTLTAGDLTFRLAAEFGFCYGVDRAVEYAYETRKRFPDRDIHITGEIIHNPHVNQRLREMGIRFLTGPDAPPGAWEDLSATDVVILPAFGVTVGQMDLLRGKGCTLVDTTCGSVLNVWKNVERYARDGFTSIIHGKYDHEETRSTASRTSLYKDGKYLVVRDHEETGIVCEHILGRGDRDAFLTRFQPAVSEGFDPDRDLERAGLANQTTMLSSESLEVAERIRQAMIARYGEVELPKHFRSFDTICSATQDRQDAVLKLLKEGVSLMLVIGGYNSSNTNHLAELSAAQVPTYHIEDSSCLVDASTIRHKPVSGKSEETQSGWLQAGPLVIGITAGASTPNNRIGEVVERLLVLRGIRPADLSLP
ncbi:MAG TPA: 4-hydroxy-3-methylbut-2-enyl diphosphate reductase [Candidatus Polarisedimenticolia bacterium]|jgi:4-hydroxy-3-methylbut-2-enyl diphosphate reductase|nr:4-hydroxy-3-methylbut-2-enyl diphosphate reductase [Candidatus Polarisedimenticolia bacterium]